MSICKACGRLAHPGRCTPWRKPWSPTFSRMIPDPPDRSGMEYADEHDERL